MPKLSLPEQFSTELLHIIHEQQLSALFQPIAALNDGQAFGFEGLIRGPSAHFLHSPINLFQTAEQCGLLSELDIACRKVVIRAFAESGLPGKLFLNVCPSSLTLPSFRPGATLEFLKTVGLAPQRVVIELTETQAISDYDLLSKAIGHYREMGFKIALDDLGEGFSSLRLWSELKPDFVKIDKYFINGINNDAQKRQFVRSIQHIALNTSTRVIAEGIETPAELETIQRIGINLAQGYLISRPQPHPSVQLQLPRLTIERPITLNQRSTTAGSLLKDTPAVSANDSNETVWQRFHAQPELYAIPVLENDRPIGLLKRHDILEMFSRPFSRELFGTRSCATQMDRQPLIVEQATSLTELARQVTSSERRYLTDGFILTEQGRYLGMGTGQDLIRAMTELQISSARHANPLTGLPGNVPIQNAIASLLQDQINFVVVYADLDHFKPYNDIYGYARGDDVLQLLGQLLQHHFDPSLDFVGHIGGDDFILLLRSSDWHLRCEQLLSDFSIRTRDFFNAEDLAFGSYTAPNRQGEIERHPLLSLSLGAAHIVASQFESHHEVASIASSAKSMAKQQQGNALFVERRLTLRNEDSKYATEV
ncbi:EAL domain-containing protein [Chitinibacter bivalviorum]|uniref:EAL domain-containing protein n=1 Tax=Chitinibacter bivalviorum TaxID=2739434 RepID=A0A7H9BNT7_9NEIS|nr:EAL domain-containing protein [Chitinibacter bivalviorum]QLG89711.1 EAL domain-containing protein [Chitinibacter bivalviorum]